MVSFWPRVLLTSMILLAMSGCSKQNWAKAVGVLIDVSGTYKDQLPDVVKIVNAGILASLDPGDSLFVVLIDDRSYEQANLIASIKLDVRPSKANQQKLETKQKLQSFAMTARGSAYSDISGALLLAAEYLRETGARRQVMLIFSDLQETLPKGTTRRFGSQDLRSMRVAALNVIKLKTDNLDPSSYRKRCDEWNARMTHAGAQELQVIHDINRLPELLAE